MERKYNEHVGAYVAHERRSWYCRVGVLVSAWCVLGAASLQTALAGPPPGWPSTLLLHAFQGGVYRDVPVSWVDISGENFGGEYLSSGGLLPVYGSAQLVSDSEVYGWIGDDSVSFWQDGIVDYSGGVWTACNTGTDPFFCFEGLPMQAQPYVHPATEDTLGQVRDGQTFTNQFIVYISGF